MQSIPSSQGDDAGATFYVSDREGCVATDTSRSGSNAMDSFEKVLEKYCEPPVQCYRYLENGEVITVSTNIKNDGTAINKRRRISITKDEGTLINYVKTSPTADGYGVEFVQKRAPHELGPQSEEERNAPAMARTRTRRFRLGRKRRVLFRRKDDKELFRDRLELHRMSILYLSDRSAGNSFVRSQHWYHDGRTFAFASALVQKDGKRKAVVALLWHTRTRPHRAVCVSFSLPERSATTESVEEKLIANCSCCHLLSQSRESIRGCYHAQISLEDEVFTKQVANEIRQREVSIESEEGGFSIFGKPFNGEGRRGCQSELTVLLDRTASSRKTLASSWLFFMTFDIDLNLFIPVVKVKGKPFKCLLCRIPLQRRGSCDHEECSIRACTTFRKQLGRGSGILSELVFSASEEKEESEDIELPHQTENVDESNGGNTSVTAPQDYTPHFRRNILPCRGEWSDMMFISKLLSNAKGDEVIVIDERNMTSCHACGLLNTKENHDGYARDIQLFTLFQGTHKVRVYDWWCHICRKVRRFSGYRFGIFPAQHNSAFTTELMYQWLEMTCFQGYSFRNAFQTTRSMQRAASRRMRHKNMSRKREGNRLGSSNAIDSEFDLDSDGSHRRRANDALRQFIELLDTSSSMVTQNLFSCENCELPLSADDCAELGIPEEGRNELKRLKAVVIDGTASGILSELPSFDRASVTVSGPKSMSTIYKTQKLLKKHPHRKALKKFLKAVRHGFRSWRKSRNRQSRLHVEENGCLRIWISKSDNIPIDGIQDPLEAFTKSESRILQLFLTENACFCSTNDAQEPYHAQAPQSDHDNACRRLRNVFRKAHENEGIVTFLRAIFSVEKGNAMRTLDPSYGTGEENENRSDDREDNSDHVEMTTMVRDEDDGVAIANGARSAVDVSQTAGNGNGDRLASDDEYEEEYDSYETQKKQVTGVWTALKVPEAENWSQFVEAMLLLLEFLVTEHVALPYVGNGPHIDLENSEISSSTESGMLGFTEHSLKLHEVLVNAIQKLRNPCVENCNRGNSTECQCMLELKIATLPISRVSPILGTFCQELIKLKKPIESDYGQLLDSVIAVLQSHMETARAYFRNMEKHCSEQCKSYWRSWAKKERVSSEQVNEHQQTRSRGVRSTPEEEEVEEAARSGICFPGRKRERPCILFKSKSEDMCNKNYKTSKSHSPGLLTVQCACDSPKLIGFVVMVQAESTAMALSAVLSHFKVFPRTVYYDNACNLFLSTMLRVPWVLGKTRFLVDRFHFKSHTCSSYFDPDAYAAFDADHTETAESINARIEKTLHQIRYLRGENLVPFLRARFAFINLAATFRAMYGKEDLEEVDMTQFFQNTFDCSCIRCTEERTVELGDD